MNHNDYKRYSTKLNLNQPKISIIFFIFFTTNIFVSKYRKNTVISAFLKFRNTTKPYYTSEF